MTSKWSHPRSDGIKWINYEVGLKDKAAADHLNNLLNTATNAYHINNLSKWSTEDINRFGNELAKVLLVHRGITNRLFRIGDPPIFQLAKRATEILPSLLEAKRRASTDE